MQRKIQVVYSLDFLAEDIFLDILSKQSNSSIMDLKKIVTAEMRTKSDLAVKMKKHINTDELIPENLINDLIFKEIEKYKYNIILKNYPRSIKQYKVFKDFLKLTKSEIFKFWKLTTNDIDKITENKIEKLGKVYCSKLDVTFDSMKEEINFRMSNLNNSIQDLIKTENIELDEINIDFERNLTTLFREKIYSV